MARCSKYLPSELVDGIVSLLDTETDILRSGSVCRLWRNSAVRRARSLPAGHHVLHGDGTGIMESHLYKHSINLVGDPDQGGWLVKVADREHVPVGKRLLNPLSAFPFRLDSLPENIPSVLPMRRFRIKELHQLYVLRNAVCWSVIYRKAAISWSSSERSGEFVLLTIKGGRLAKFNSFKRKWTLLADRSGFKDVIVHKGELLGVDITGRVVIIDKEDNDGEERLIVAAIGSPRLLSRKKYLVQSIDGELVLVERYELTNVLRAGIFGSIPMGS